MNEVEKKANQYFLVRVEDVIKRPDTEKYIDGAIRSWRGEYDNNFPLFALAPTSFNVSDFRLYEQRRRNATLKLKDTISNILSDADVDKSVINTVLNLREWGILKDFLK
jgi:hypothetical protein